MKYRVIQTIQRECFIEADCFDDAKDTATELSDDDFESNASYLMNETIEEAQ